MVRHFQLNLADEIFKSTGFRTFMLASSLDVTSIQYLANGPIFLVWPFNLARASPALVRCTMRLSGRKKEAWRGIMCTFTMNIKSGEKKQPIILTPISRGFRRYTALTECKYWIG